MEAGAAACQSSALVLDSGSPQNRLQRKVGSEFGCLFGVITDADFFPDGLAIDPIADMIDALGMMLRCATHETPGTETPSRIEA